MGLGRVATRRGAAAAPPVQPAARVLVVTTGLAGIGAALCYSSFMLAPLVGSQLRPAASFVSELGVTGQPASAFFRATDATAGLLIVVFAIGMARLRGPSRRGRLGCAGLAAVGVASCGDGLVPMPCSPSINPACEDTRHGTDTLLQLQQPHTLTSVLGVSAAITAMVLLGVHLRGQPRWRGLGRASIIAALLVTALAGGEVILTFADLGAGIPERMHVLLISAWLAALGWRVLDTAGCGQGTRVPGSTSFSASGAPLPP